MPVNCRENTLKASPFLIDVIINLLLAIFVAFQISMGWAITYILIYILITIKTLEHTNIEGGEARGLFIATIKDIFTLGICLVFNLVIETGMSAFSKLFVQKGKRAQEDSEDLKNVGEALNNNGLLLDSEQATKASEQAISIGKSLQEYNDVFWGLNSTELTLGVYFLAKILLVIWILLTIKKKNTK
jgi:hypothetical protein